MWESVESAFAASWISAAWQAGPAARLHERVEGGEAGFLRECPPHLAAPLKKVVHFPTAIAPGYRL